MEVGGQRHAPASLPPGKDPAFFVQKYDSPYVQITAHNMIILQVTEK